MKAAIVHWDDAHNYQGPVDYEEVDENELKVISAGILISEDELVVRLCQDSWPSRGEKSTAEQRRGRHIAIIPKKYITKMKVYEIE